MSDNFIKLCLLIGLLAGLPLLLLSIYFVLKYVMCSGELCHEILMIPAIFSFIGSPCFILASWSVTQLKSELPNFVRVVVYSLTLVTIATLLFFLVHP